MIDARKAQWKEDRLMKKNIAVATRRKQIFKGKKLTIGMDLGDRFASYCVLDEAGEVMVEQQLPTTKQGMQQVFGGGLAQGQRTHASKNKTVLTHTGLVMEGLGSQNLANPPEIRPQ